jgi:hypothetical protein
MGELYVVGLVITALVALLAVPVLYIWAWAMGPAVRHLGKKWEEGRQRAATEPLPDDLISYLRALRRDLDALQEGHQVIRGPEVTEPTAAPEKPKGPPRRWGLVPPE